MDGATRDTGGSWRIGAARRRAAVAKKALAATAVALFAAVLVGERASHPGASANHGAATSADQVSDGDEVEDFGFGQSEIGPATGTASTGTSVS